MDKATAANYLHRQDMPRLTNTPNDKPSAGVKSPFQFKFSSQTQRAPAGTSFQRLNLNFGDTSKLVESTPTRMFDAVPRSLPFESSGLHKQRLAATSAYIDLIDRGEENPKASRAPFNTDVRGDALKNFDKHSHEYAITFPDQGVIKRDESVDVSLREVPESDDLLVTITSKYRQLQRESTKQRDYIAELEGKLASTTEQHTTLCASVAQLKAARATQKEELDKITKDFVDLGTGFQDLKALSNSSASFLSEAKETMHSLVQLRDSTQFELKVLESAFDDDGKLVLTQETRTTLDELRCELTTTQQVADLLRDKLHVMASELAEARSRISELEGLTVGDTQTVERVTLHLRQSAEHVAVVMNFLQEERKESVRAAGEVYEMTQQLAQSHARLKEAETQILSMRRQMTEYEEAQEDQKVQLRFLRTTNDFQERTNRELGERLQNINEELRLALNRSHELEGRSDAFKEHEANLLQQNLNLRSERDTVNETLSTAQHQLAEAHTREISLSRQLSKVTAERDGATENLKDMDILKGDLELCRRK